MRYIPSGCGIFAMLRKNKSKKIPGKYVVSGISEVKHRGSDRGAGYAMFNFDSNNYYIRAFSDYDIKEDLERFGFNVLESDRINLNGVTDRCYHVSINNNMMLLERINNKIWPDSRIYSYGKLNVMKGIGYPEDVAKLYDIDKLSADMWLAHTRHPTNSPGELPFWSHPFSSFNVAIVHNGDISSFGSNARYIESLGIKSLVGTDSEAVAYLFNDLVRKNDVLKTVKILSGDVSDDLKRYYKNAMLDGPYSMAIGYDSGSDLYLIAMVDRHKFRPIYVGEDDNYYYVASEISQITEISRNAMIWPLKSGSYFIASMKNGIISGFDKNINLSYTGIYDIDAENIEYNKINSEIMKINKNNISIINVHGHKYIGMGLRNLNIKIYGNPGNCLANLNDKNNIEVFGNVLDDCCDAMSSGNVFIHGSAGDTLGQAMSGGAIYIKDSTQSRTGIQMRSYGNVPYIIIGKTFGDYLGEYMAGGRIIVLGNNKNTGRFIGAGMLSGKIYINGRVNKENIGIKNDNKRLLTALKNLKKFDKNINIKNYIKNEDNIKIEYRYLNDDELNEISVHVKIYDEHFNTKYINRLKNRFTIISGLH